MKPIGFYEGDRSEYLAPYVLSALGFTVPVPRQSDAFGADFLTQTDRSCRPGGPKGDSRGRKPPDDSRLHSPAPAGRKEAKGLGWHGRAPFAPLGLLT